MNTKEALDKIRILVFGEDTPPVAPVAPVALSVDYPLADGSVLTIDKLDVGGIVTKDSVPVMDMNYTLADGTEITTVSGLITEMEAPKEEPIIEAPVVPAAMTEVTKAQFDELKKSFDKQTETMKAMFSVMENMSIVAPVEKVSKSFEDMTNYEKLKANRGEL